MTAARWLFLDFDGVVHGVFPRKDRTDEQNAHWAFLPTLADVLRRHPKVDIVISSSWRRDRSLAVLQGFFPDDLASRVVGATPLSDHPYGPGGRQAEIEAWLHAHAASQDRWVAVDDVPDLFEPGAALVVAQDGFFDEEVQALDAALTDPQTWAVVHPVPPRTLKLWLPTP